MTFPPPSVVFPLNIWKHLHSPPGTGDCHLCFCKLCTDLYSPVPKTICSRTLTLRSLLPMNNVPRPHLLWNSPLYGIDAKMASLKDGTLGAAMFLARQHHSWTKSGRIHNCTWFRVSRPRPHSPYDHVRNQQPQKGQWQG